MSERDDCFFKRIWTNQMLGTQKSGAIMPVKKKERKKNPFNNQPQINYNLQFVKKFKSNYKEAQQATRKCR